MDIKKYLNDAKNEVDSLLETYLPKDDDYPPEINKAVRYSMFAGGKRVRPVLMMASADVVGGEKKFVLPYAAAIEMIHTYTLIHDDLPALDNDDLRRGKPTNHKIFGEAIALLAGDSLLTMAFQIMSDPGLTKGIPPAVICRVINEMAVGVGVDGTIGGQVVDIQSEKKKIDINTLEYIHTHKTGKMIRAAIRTGCILSGGSEEELQNLTTYAERIGLAFQVIDDILDIEGDEKDLGKDIKSDLDKDKATYPSIVGMEKSKEIANRLMDEALVSLLPFGEKGLMLKGIAEYIIKRRN